MLTQLLMICHIVMEVFEEIFDSNFAMLVTVSNANIF